jgi:organic radical activating enzyme
MIIPKIIWNFSGSCNNDCWYCHSSFRNYPYYKTTEEYLHVIDLLQNHGQRSLIPKMNWKFKGGEPLQFTNFNILLKQIKTKDSHVTIETSGGNSWFDILEVSGNVDELILTHHYWQNETVLDYLIDFMQEQDKKITVFVPMLPDKINECRAIVQGLKDRGVEAIEQLLLNEQGGSIEKYSMRDLNIYYKRPEDWTPPPPPPPVPRDPNLPDPAWVDPRIDDGAPVYTGKPCWAGVDYMHIDVKGWAKGSDCNGRDLGNVFEPGWLPPDLSFACPMMFCRSNNDKRNIRINQN